MNGHLPGLFDRLINDRSYAPEGGVVSRLSIEQLTDSVARDLESLLNTRMLVPTELLARYPGITRSMLDYGLIDFAAFSLANDADRQAICASLQAAIERHEPRLRHVSATLDGRESGKKHLNFYIAATLQAYSAIERVNFNATLDPSAQHYSISQVRAGCAQSTQGR